MAHMMMMLIDGVSIANYIEETPVIIATSVFTLSVFYIVHIFVQI